MRKILIAFAAAVALAGCSLNSTGAIAPQTLVAAANGLSGANTACVAANAGLVIVNTQPALTHLVKNNGAAIAAEQAACQAIEAIDSAVVASQAQAAAPVAVPVVTP